jgi:ankyrin repeat protein
MACVRTLNACVPHTQGGHTALMRAAIWGHLECARVLLASGADVGAINNVRIVIVLYSNPECSYIPLFDLCRFSVHLVVRCCFLNLQDGDTVLICAAVSGQTTCVRLLLEGGANKQARNNVRACGIMRRFRNGVFI